MPERRKVLNNSAIPAIGEIHPPPDPEAPYCGPLIGEVAGPVVDGGDAVTSQTRSLTLHQRRDARSLRKLAPYDGQRKAA